MSHRRTILIGAVAAFCACGGGDDGPTQPTPPANRAPVTVGTLASLTLEEGAEATINVASNFNDPDGDALTYSAVTSDATVAAASVSGSMVVVTAVGAGTATITVTATDPGGLSANQAMSVTVELANLPPTVVGELDGQTRTVAVGDTLMADLSEAFSDPEGDPLTFTAISTDTVVATASVDGSTLTVVALAAGSH
jgi:hypothetical protein